ncbi:MAG: hypothetical protein OSA78_04410 [Flavobacteriales bacterium]|nr:hypothetical protein [Flavobacteriales bacterium]
MLKQREHSCTTLNYSMHLQDGVIWSYRIIELEPTADGSPEIVWDCTAWEHLVQDFDPRQTPGAPRISLGRIRRSD